MKEIDTPEAFGFWLSEAKTGERCIYYEGLLMRDREIHLREAPTAPYPSRIQCAHAAKDAYWLDKKVILFQKKKEEMHYEYYAQKV